MSFAKKIHAFRMEREGAAGAPQDGGTVQRISE
jgi:hypothetical protein